MTQMGTFLEYERPSTVAGCLFSQYTLMESLVVGSELALNPRGSTTASRTRRTSCTSGRWISMVALSFGRWGTGTQMRLSPTGSQPVRNTVITIEATMNVRNRRPACLSRPSLQRGKTLPRDVSRRR